MINQPLLDFIKQQLQAGVTKEKISSQLLDNGWNMQDVEEGFKAINVSSQTSIPPAILSSIANNPINQQQKTQTPVQNINLKPDISSFINNKPAEQKISEPQVTQAKSSPILGQIYTQQTESKTIDTAVAVHPFIKYGLIIGIVGFIFFLFSFLSSSIGKSNIINISYLAAIEIALCLISVFCIILSAKMLKCKDRTFVKALSIFGIAGLFTGLIYLDIFFKLPGSISLVILIAWIGFTLFFSTKIYSISFLRAFVLYIVYVLLAMIASVILFFAVGFSFLFSLFNIVR